ncbi:MAG: radical SAM family heme chaperone HemW [Clostridia bacterium]|nr:radical SAM family heme chaperone HemW [Clostridia bacterium]
MAGIYLHIPFCKHKCTYCDFTSFPNRMNFAEAYMACLYKEIEMRAKELEGKVFDTVYFGGGTPSVIDPNYIYGAMKKIKQCLKLSKNPEITIEMNPGTVSEEKIAIYKRAGINRFSIGLQTAIDSQLEEIGRIHNVRDYLYCTSLLKGENFSTDIMLGLKGQTKDDVKKTVEIAAGSGAKHISMYALTPEDGTPIYSDYLNGELPDSDEVASLYEYGYALLKEKGYYRYEVSNFAVKGYESKHNLNYWRRGEYIGFGLSASSFMNGRRFTNTLNLDEYIKCILSGFLPVIDNAAVEGEDAKFEFVMLALRTREGISAAAYQKAFGSDWKEDFKAAYEKTKEYLEESGDITRIRDEYLYVQNGILTQYLS